MAFAAVATSFQVARAGLAAPIVARLAGRQSVDLLPRPAAFAISPGGISALGSVRTHYRFARPPSPVLDELRRVITVKLTPVHFYVVNDLGYGYTTWAYDMHFRGILCSPKFEGKTYKEMHTMVNDCAAEAGLPEGRLKMICQPPSRWNMMRKRARRRWNLDM